VGGEGNGPRAALPDPATFSGKMEYKDNCVLITSADGKATTEHHIDYIITRVTPPDFYCQACQNLIKRETAAKKVGDAVGGFSGAFGKGVFQGLKRNR